MEKEKKYGIARISNPWPKAYVVELRADGRAATEEVRRWLGTWGKFGKPLYRGMRVVLPAYDPTQPGGFYNAKKWKMIDATPRSFAEAVEEVGRAGNSLIE